MIWVSAIGHFRESSSQRNQPKTVSNYQAVLGIFNKVAITSNSEEFTPNPVESALKFIDSSHRRGVHPAEGALRALPVFSSTGIWFQGSSAGVSLTDDVCLI